MGIFGDIGDGLSKVGHGVEDGVNAGLSGIEDGIDAGERMLGEGVDWATDKTGGLLDQVGLHGAADTVEDWGDDVASDLGATPGEQQLGQTDEANELVHGNPDKIRGSAKHLRDFHTAFDHVGQGMRGLDSSHWRGEGGDAFREKFEMHPTKWLQAADACEKAAGALETFADTVKWAQGKAQDAIDLYKKGQHTSEQAVSAYNGRVDAYNAKIRAHQDPGPRPEPFKDPGQADIGKAREMLADARRGRNEAGGHAESAMRAAVEHAPAEPPPLSRIGNDLIDGFKATDTELTHLAGGVIKGTAGLVDFARGLNPIDPYNLTHPADYLQNVSMTLSGLVSTVAHPERVVQAAVDGFKKDPSEFIGRLIPELIGTKGAGLARGGLRLALKDGLKEGAETGARRAVEREGEAVARRQAEKTCAKDPVDVATGRMLLPQTDITLPGLLPLVFQRQFESSYRSGRWFGPTWSSTLDQRLEIDAAGVVFVGEDGLLLTYPHPAPGVPTLPDHGPRWPLERTVDGYTLTNPESGHTRHFADHGEDLALLEQIDDRNGHWITLDHTPDGTPLCLTHSGGYQLTFTTTDTRVTALHLTGAASDGTDQDIVRYGYSAEGHLTDVTNSSGLPTTFGYDDQGRITSWTDTNDSSFTYTYDDHDRCAAQSGAAGHLRSTFTYTPTDPSTGLRTTTITDSLGHTSHYTINARAQVIAETDANGSASRYTRDERNRLLLHTDPLGHTTEFHYDPAGNLVTVTRPDGREARAEYNELGLPVKVIQPDGTTHHQTYDERGNRTSVTDPAGNTTLWAHDDAGRLTAVTDPLGHTTTIRCDPSGQPIEIIDPLGSVTRHERDAFGRPVSTTDPTGAVTRYEWTVEGALTRRTTPDGTVETWAYDGEGNCTTHVDPVGGLTRFAYGDFDLLTGRTAPDGTRYRFDYDTELRLCRVTNPQGLSWEYTYDPAGLLMSETDFDGRTITYTQDAAGRLATRTNALGQTIAFERNALGHVTRKDADGEVTTYVYDFTDQLAQGIAPDGTLSVLRDHLGRVRSETVDGRTLTYAYDELGRRTGRTTPMGATSTWSYDAAGRRTRLIASGHTVDFVYDPSGREISRRVDDNLTLANTYDTAGRLTNQWVTRGPSQPLQQRTYTYRADGHLLAIDDQLRGMRRFDLDAAGRVTIVHATHWRESYAYDEAGNQTSASWSATHPGQEATGPRAYSGTRITRAGNVRYEHDALGRIILRQKTRLSRRPDTWRYEWDAEDRLTSVTTPDGTRWRYTYDPLGRRTSKQRLAADGQTVTEQTLFTWDGTTLCEQTTVTDDAPNAVTLTWNHGGLAPLTQTESITRADTHPTLPSALTSLSSPSLPPTDDTPDDEIASRFFAIITDLVGTPTELIGEDGTVAWHTRTTLWGTTTWNTSATAYTPLRFPGQYYDPETGLHHNYFRTYDPETARYLTPDPLGLEPAPNPATYVHNPCTSADPLGLAPDECSHRVERVPEDELSTLYHYTNEKGYNGILESNELNPSLKASNPKDARFGDGQYMSDIAPGTKTAGQLSYAFVRVPWAGHKFNHFIEVDVRGLDVMRSVERPDVYVIPGQDALDLTGRIVSHGKN